ncbi:MAG: hypothetical protein Q8P92_03205 [Candidatus Daviesbacteria bacterium]|nr:hypothetical protein [Candidatus Daviesbacteria bacterium]
MGQLEHFIAPDIKYQQLYQDILTKNPLSAGAALWEVGQTLTQAGLQLEAELKEIFIQTQQVNQDWAEGRFRVLREGEGKQLLDGMVVDEEGRAVIRPWSSFADYTRGDDLPPTLGEMRNLITAQGRLLFPVTPSRDSFLFWLYSDQASVLQLLVEERLDQGLETKPYAIEPSIAQAMPDMVMTVSIKRGKVGIGKFAQKGMVLGIVGFWEHTHSDLSEGRGYIGKVRVEASKLTEHIELSPLEKREVILSGGLPMDEKHNVTVLRMDPQIARRDLIAAAFQKFTGESKHPLVLRFNAYRPWLGEFPKHG